MLNSHHTLLFLLLFGALVSLSVAVDRAKFKTCKEAGFCLRHRNYKGEKKYSVVGVTLNETALEAVLRHKSGNTESKFRLNIVALEDSTVRVTIDDVPGALRKRFWATDALAAEPKQQKLTETSEGKDNTTLITKDGNKIILVHQPFRVDIYSKKVLVASLNSDHLFKMEHFVVKKETQHYGEGYWDESFDGKKDGKPFGSSSVGIDVTFVGYRYLFGLPEHADAFALRQTLAYEPYRLYNLDVFEYEQFSTMALYGSIPYVVAPGPERTIGFLWLNPSETWVDVALTHNTRDSLAPFLQEDQQAARTPTMQTRFVSETGVADMFFFLGPQVGDVFRQQSALTGRMPLPPAFALAYHQSRWNYNDEADLLEVHENFDKHDIPVDVLWLDIEHTDGKKYFTWDKSKFPDPKGMVKKLTAKGRRLVTIVDPHIKKDDDYVVYAEAKKNGFFVKDSIGASDYEGNCWPGTSSYLDFANPQVRDFWASLFAYDKYYGTSDRVLTWNDMNEPSVFSGPEVTMHKDARHFGDWEHREVHNLYGFWQHSSTFAGQLARSNGEKRPFVLSRAFFAGSQRTASVWTGDNTASWPHLKMTAPMTLSLSIAGIPHSGADVGGFFGNPDEELLVRWYQAAAFQPFFRAHAHIDTRRREPWLLPSEKAQKAIRLAIRKRYSFLLYWYTLFHEYTLTGKPPMRPLWAEFPTDEACYDEDREWLIGSALAVRPVQDAGAQNVSLYLPGRNQIWYDWATSKARPSPGAVYLNVTLGTIPLFQRGGTIVPVRERVRRSSPLMRNDPVTLYVALNLRGDHANGTVYLDDEETLDYQKGEEGFAYWVYTFKKDNDYVHTLRSKRIAGKLDSPAVIERIVLRGVKFFPRTVHVYLDDFTPEPLEFEHDREDYTVVIRDPQMRLTREWRLDFHT